MIKCDGITREKRKKHNKSCRQIPHHRHRILIIGGSGSGKKSIT